MTVLLDFGAHDLELAISGPQCQALFSLAQGNASEKDCVAFRPSLASGRSLNLEEQTGLAAILQQCLFQRAKKS
eukprot:scaffold169914_cov14-Prasinocladus_malaysianus.AAC.1